MTTYNFSTLTNNQTIVFNPLVDILLFDTTTRPAELLINGTASGVQFSVGGKSIVLSGITLDDLGTQGATLTNNVQFVSPGTLVVGEGTTAQNGDLANLITGQGGDDALLGLGGNDTLDGGSGRDLMAGFAGDDLYKVDDVADVVTEESSTGGTDRVEAVVSYTLTNNVENLSLLGTSAINGTGNTLANILLGNANANVLDGKTGADLMIAGDGNDSYFVDNIGDIVRETNSSATQIDTVNSSISFTLGANFENLTLILTSSIAGKGNFRDNQIIGNAGANTLNGAYGADTMTGGDGNDTYIVDNIGDQVSEISNSLTQIDLVASSLSYTLGANLENLRLLGAANIDATGNGLNNTLYANAGNNIINGSLGTDTASYATVSLQTLGGSSLTALTVTSSVTTAGVSVNLSLAGVQDTQGSGFDQLISIENLTGSQFNDELTGTIGANILDGGTGADVLTGGKGSDTYVVDGADEVIELNGNSDGLDLVLSSVSYRLAANVEYLTLTGSAANGIGNNLDNQLVGNSGANFLDGRAGADKMDGGSGNDTFVVDNLGDEITDSSGTDLVMSYVNQTLGNTVENLRLMGINALNGNGNGLNNVVWANIGDNVVDGGNDTLVAGFRGDTLSYEYGATGGITLDLSVTAAQATGGSGTDTVSNFEHLTGSTYDDLLSGTDAANSLDGSSGVDTVSYESALAGVTVDLTLQTAITGLVTDTVRNFENIIGSGFDDLLVGDLAANVFDGSGGIAGGNDTVSYRNVKLDEGGVAANLALIGPQNTLASGYDSFISIENLTGSLNDDSLTGDAGANILDGSDGNDSLTGAGGADKLNGGQGNDLLKGGIGSDLAFYLGTLAATVNLSLGGAQLTGYGLDTLLSVENLTSGSGNDSLTGDAAANTFISGLGLDTLSGNGGDDVLHGGLANDRLTGGIGLDTFVFDTELAADNIDRITDFTVVDDVIRLEDEVFTALAAGALTAAAFVANASGAALDISDRIIYETGTGNLFYDSDGTGAAVAVRFAVLNAGLALTHADFLVM